MTVRLKVSLPEEHHALLRRLAAQQGVSMSSILADLFATAAPVLERVADAVDKVSRAQGEVKDRLRGSLEEFETALMPILREGTQRLEAFDDQLALTLDAGTGDARSTASGPAAEPPPSNTGVNSPENAPTRGKSHAL